jgi:hypothetical protein
MALSGHPEAMKMSCRQGYFRTSAWKVFSEVRLRGLVDIQYDPTAGPTALDRLVCLSDAFERETPCDARAQHPGF